MFISSYEPCREKTCLWGFRPVLTQNGICSHSRWLEALKVEGLYYLCSENKGAELCYCFHICKKQVFCGRGSFNFFIAVDCTNVTEPSMCKSYGVKGCSDFPNVNPFDCPNTCGVCPCKYGEVTYMYCQLGILFEPMLKPLKLSLYTCEMASEAPVFNF